MIITGDRYEVLEITKSMFEVKMSLVIKKFRRSDAGEYHCVAKNSLGDVDSKVKLHGRYFKNYNDIRKYFIEIVCNNNPSDQSRADHNKFTLKIRNPGFNKGFNKCFLDFLE